jgi:hypothetical protein
MRRETGCIPVRWPIALVVALIVFFGIFWKPIAGAINRIQRAKVGENAVEFSEHRRVERQAGLQSEVATPASTATANVAATSTTTTNVVEASHAMPPPYEAYAPLEEQISNALPVDRPAEVERAWLIRALVVVSVLRTHDTVYRLIFGSQLGLLLQANTGAPPNMDQARAMYDAAAGNFPEVYAGFSFEEWLDFPIRMSLAVIEPLADRPAVIRISRWAAISCITSSTVDSRSRSSDRGAVAEPARIRVLKTANYPAAATALAGRTSAA